MSKSLLLIAAAALGTGALTLHPAGTPPPAEVLTFTGGCDASAAIRLDATHLLVADDEDKKKGTLLRLYDLAAPGAPTTTVELTKALAPADDDLEVDLEGLTAFDGRLAIIGSHSRKGDKGSRAPSRHRLLAFAVEGTAATLRLAASTSGPYTSLVTDGQAFLAGLPGGHPLPGGLLDPDKPSKAGGLSIEALADTTTPGELLIGLRSPLGTDGTALVLRLTNAQAVLESQAPPRFAPPIRLSLKDGGTALGLRDLVRDGDRGYLVLAGLPGDGGAFSLWRWAGPGSAAAPVKVRDVETFGTGTSAEAVALTPGREAAWILYDEGQRPLPDPKPDLETCKDLPGKERSFRARRVPLT